MAKIVIRPGDWAFGTATGATRAADESLRKAVELYQVHGIDSSRVASGEHEPNEDQEFSCGIRRLAPGTYNPPHHFDQPEVIYVISGTVTVGEGDGGDRVELGPGDIVYQDAYERFDMQVGLDEPLIAMVLFPRGPRVTF